MLFYVQMKWNYQGRISQDQLWQLEEKEGEHAMQGVKSGMVIGIYKVVSQHRIIVIVDADSLDNLDRNSMGWLPMREYLEFEEVWALRSYQTFLEDVKERFPLPSATPSSDSLINNTPATQAEGTQSVANAWFSNLSQGKFEDAMNLLDDDVVWENIQPVAKVSDVAPWLGSYKGKKAVLKSFDVWAKYSKMLNMILQQLFVDGQNAIGIVHEHAQCLANSNEYDLYVATHLTIANNKIIAWKVYWDPSPLIKAYKSL